MRFRACDFSQLPSRNDARARRKLRCQVAEIVIYRGNASHLVSHFIGSRALHHVADLLRPVAPVFGEDIGHCFTPTQHYPDNNWTR
jgi:hypothetical protein